MIQNKKTMLNLGWLFYEQKMLDKMSKYAQNGWKLTNISAFKFDFEKSEPEDCIFSMDFKQNIEDENEYFSIFQASGWTHVCSYMGYHIFKAVPNTTPIYTERDCNVQRFKNFNTAANLMLLCSLSYLLLLFLIIHKLEVVKNNPILNSIATITGLVSGGILGMSVVMSIGYLLNKRLC